MSSTLHLYVHGRFREAFGEPQHTLGNDDHWSLRSSGSEMSINVLLNGTLETPAVWVFDPHDPDDEVYKKLITENQQADDIITQLHARLKHARRQSGKGGLL
ncbi:MAG: hypothetical protein L0219_07975 [Phycisphaerales bacterium]|nr:hypothetical protein [Phycisphaerales bacterium]